MIYPYQFPENRSSEHAEKKVFERLEPLKDHYDIFYNKSFISDVEKEEFEIDFIIAEKADRENTCNVIICLEVKGGIVEFDGVNNIWLQNGEKSSKDFQEQATGTSHKIIRKYPNLAKGTQIEWVLCFPDCEKPDNVILPNNMTDLRTIDKLELLHIEDTINHIFSYFKNNSNKNGSKYFVYDSFKKDLLRNIGFIETLGARFKYEEEKFVKLTNVQIDFFKRIFSNNKIITKGYAGTGKTLIAIATAIEKLRSGKKILFLCFNRTLANNIRYSFDKYDDGINVATFHSLAKDLIDKKSSTWWEEHDNKTKDFWDIEVPSYLDEIIQDQEPKYDVVIIDEGQDFKELWYEIIFRLLKKDGQKFIFLDPFQDIFNNYNNIPNYESFLTFDLNENCRNTKTIVNELSGIIDAKIPVNSALPHGDAIIKKEFKNRRELLNEVKNEIKNLVNKEKVSTDKILLMLKSDKKDSSSAELNKIGKLEISGLSRNSKFKKDHIHFTTINVFKGLEVDVLFIIDTQNIKNEKLLYTQISRGRNKVFIFKIN